MNKECTPAYLWIGFLTVNIHHVHKIKKKYSSYYVAMITDFVTFSRSNPNFKVEVKKSIYTFTVVMCVASPIVGAFHFQDSEPEESSLIDVGL